jgi:hypothetical protein
MGLSGASRHDVLSLLVSASRMRSHPARLLPPGCGHELLMSKATGCVRTSASSLHLFQHLVEDTVEHVDDVVDFARACDKWGC